MNSNFPVLEWIEFGFFFLVLVCNNLLLRFFAECYIKSKYVCVKKYCLNQTLGFIVFVMQKDLFQPEINVTQEILKIESEFIDGKKIKRTKKVLSQ